MGFNYGEIDAPSGRTMTEDTAAKTRTRAFIYPRATIEGLIPAWNAAHPDEALLHVMGRDIRDLTPGGDQIAIITYSLPATHGVDEEYDLSAVQTTVTSDIDNNPIPNGATVYEPRIIYRKIAVITPFLPLATISPLVGKTNSNAPFKNGLQFTWLLRGAPCRELREDLWEVQYVFEYDVNEWRHLFKNIETQANQFYRLYESGDMSTLPGI